MSQRSSVPPNEVPSWVLDALLGTVVALAIALIIATDQGGQRAPDLVAYLFAAGFGALMLLRRTWPRTMLVLTVLTMFGYYIMDYPPIGVAVPVVAALFATADAGLTWWSAGAGAMVLVVSVYFRLEEGMPLVFLLGYEMVSNIALIVTAIALGYSLRTRRAVAAQRDEIAWLTEAQTARDAELRMRREREGISRDLHDTVGHTMSVIALQGGVVAEAIGHDDAAVREAAARIREASARSLRDMRAMVRMLRAGEHDPEALSLADVAVLWGPAREAGIEVFDEVAVDATSLPSQLDSTAYRVIQEALTNVVRHSGAARVWVAAWVARGELSIEITDDGQSGGVSAGGYGLAGMTERVRLLGGAVSTGPESGGGFAVRARIPVSS